MTRISIQNLKDGGFVITSLEGPKYDNPYVSEPVFACTTLEEVYKYLKTINWNFDWRKDS